MKDWLLVGMALGFLVGAVLVEGNKKVEEVVKNGKTIVANKVKQMVTENKQNEQN